MNKKKQGVASVRVCLNQQELKSKRLLAFYYSVGSSMSNTCTLFHKNAVQARDMERPHVSSHK